MDGVRVHGNIVEAQLERCKVVVGIWSGRLRYFERGKNGVETENYTHPATQRKPQARESTQVAALQEKVTQHSQELWANHRICDTILTRYRLKAKQWV